MENNDVNLAKDKNFFGDWRPRPLWGVGYLVSCSMSAKSGSYKTVQQLAGNLAQGKVLEGLTSAASGACTVVQNYGSDVATAVKLGVGTQRPIAPEALGVTDAQWELLGSADAVRHLREYAACKSDDDVVQHVPTFLEAAKILTLAATLSYATETKANKLLAEHEIKNWVATLVTDDTVKRAQAMLLTSKSDAASPMAILAFRGTELPEDDNEGWLEFCPDWLRNLDFRPTEAPGGGNVAHGFFEAWNGPLELNNGKSLRANVVDAIHAFSAKCGGRPVDLYVTGHSAGGSLAQMSLLDLLKAQDEDVNPVFRLRACLTLAQPRFCDEAYTKRVEEAMRNIPLDMLANEDITGVDPCVSVGGPWTKEPPGRFWIVHVGEALSKPTDVSHVVLADPPSLTRRLLMSVPLHWPGGRVGYLSALGA